MKRRVIELLFVWSWNAFTRLYGIWCRTTYPAANINTLTAHMHDEIDELKDEVKRVGTPEANLEVGDIILLLADTCFRYRLNGGRGAVDKFRINENRTWARDEKGCYVHVKPHDDLEDVFERARQTTKPRIEPK